MTRIFFLLCVFLLLSWCPSILAQTVLQAGDLVVVGLASNVGGDLGDCTPDGSGQFLGRDRVSFVCFKDIMPGTLIDITDNGWERENAGLWGNTEGFIRATRSGGTIPAGTLITFEFPPTQTNSVAISPDGDWTFSILGTNALNFNDSGDQIYFLQGGTWDNGTVLGCCNGEQDAAYVGGRLLFGFNSKSTWNGFLGDSQNSALHPEVIPCFNMAPTSGVTSFSSYSGPLTETTQLEWIARVSNPENWTAFEDCASYQDPPANFAIGPSGMFISCKVCQSCAAFSDTLIFNLPATGGPFSISYSNGQDTFSLMNVNSGAEVPISVDATTSYQLIRVTDANSCPVYSNFESGADLIVQTDPPLLSCVTGAAAPNGTVVFSISGGTSPYTISWRHENGQSGSISGEGSAPVTISGLSAAGMYEAQLTDASGCTDDCTFELEGPDCGLQLALEGMGPQCGDPGSGRINALVSGEQGSVQYEWGHNELSGPENVNLAAGEYSLTVTDEAGCMDSSRLVLLEAGQLEVNLELAETSSCGSEWGILITDLSGGRPPYSVRLDPSSTPIPIGNLPFSLENLIPGNYNLVFEDQAVCQLVFPITVPVNNSGNDLILDLGFDTQVQIGQGVRIDPLINFNPVMVEWSPETAIEDPGTVYTTIRPDRTTLYTATLTDINGCTITDSILITVAKEEKVFIPTAFSPNHDGVNDFFLLFPGPEIAEIRSFRIFDRWGNLVFEALGLPPDFSGWNGELQDGRKAASGIYLYFTELLDQDGREEVLRGSVTLIR